MAREFHDLGFRLPSESLTDDDLLAHFRPHRLTTRRCHDFSYGFGSSFGFNSDMSSPGEMVTSSTETESEEDRVVSELTRKLAQSTLRNCDFSSNASNCWKLSGSSQSTLCGCKLGSVDSANSMYDVWSPPDAEYYLLRDCLHERMRMIEESAAYYSSELLAPHVKRSSSPSEGLYPIQAGSQIRISSQLLQAAKLQHMMKKGVHVPRVMEFQFQNESRNCGEGRVHDSPMTAWPGLQQPISGTQAVFRSEPEPKKERMGTGVFFPKRFGVIPADNGKKSGSPTVSLPVKVVHALNLDVESIDSHLQRKIDFGTSNFDYDAAAVLKHRNNVIMAQKRRILSAQPTMNQQLRLPQEWTY